MKKVRVQFKTVVEFDQVVQVSDDELLAIESLLPNGYTLDIYPAEPKLRQVSDILHSVMKKNDPVYNGDKFTDITIHEDHEYVSHKPKFKSHDPIRDLMGDMKADAE